MAPLLVALLPYLMEMLGNKSKKKKPEASATTTKELGMDETTNLMNTKSFNKSSGSVEPNIY